MPWPGHPWHSPLVTQLMGRPRRREAAENRWRGRGEAAVKCVEEQQGQRAVGGGGRRGGFESDLSKKKASAQSCCQHYKGQRSTESIRRTFIIYIYMWSQTDFGHVEGLHVAREPLFEWLISATNQLLQSVQLHVLGPISKADIFLCHKMLLLFF